MNKLFVLSFVLILLGAGCMEVQPAPTEPVKDEIPLGGEVSSQCGIENCHGMDIKCGVNPAEICTEIYQMGDKCRRYAKCGIVGRDCVQLSNDQFNTCKACVEKCLEQEYKDPVELSVCESKCE